MRDKRLEEPTRNLIAHPKLAQSVVRVDPSEFEVVAKVLAAGFANDPLHIWAMPNEATRLADATMFFTFYLRRMKKDSREVFTTPDRSVVLVTSLVRKGASAYPDGVRYLSAVVRRGSPANDYFQWLDTLRPKVDHRYGEFLVSLPNAHRRGGFLAGFHLLANVLKMCDREGLPFWTWTSNPRNLAFFRRLGFELGADIRKDAYTPPVTPMWHPPAPVVP
jgi:hypothetical protein